jgi:hypothetical protein
VSDDAEAKIVRTEHDIVMDRWMYLLDNGKIVKGASGDARIPAGMAFNERNQWAANRVFGTR